MIHKVTSWSTKLGRMVTFKKAAETSDDLTEVEACQILLKCGRDVEALTELICTCKAHLKAVEPHKE